MSNALVQYNCLPVPSESVDVYIRQVNDLPILSAEEERSLARRLRLEGDLVAAQRLILSHLRFVVAIARSYGGYGLALGDLIQEGNIGLMKAVKRFDPDHEVRLASYAAHWIRAQIQEFVIRNWRIVKVATTKAQRKLFFNLRSAKKQLGWLNSSEAQAVADDLNVKKDTVYEMEARLSGQDITFDMANDDETDNVIYSPIDYLQADQLDTLGALASDEWQKQAQDMLPRALARLDERSRAIVERRWLAEKKATLHELADEYGVSAERIRQIETSAIKKLKAFMAELA